MNVTLATNKMCVPYSLVYTILYYGRKADGKYVQLNAEQIRLHKRINRNIKCRE